MSCERAALNPTGHLGEIPAARLGQEFRAHLAEKIRQNIICAFAFGPMNHPNGLRRQLDFRIQFGDGRVVPHFDLPKKNIGQHGPRQFQFTRCARQVVDDYDSDQHRRQFHHRNCGALQLLLGNGSVATAQISHAC